MNHELKILVVDPNQEGARITANLCTSIGMKTEVRGNIEEAVESIQKTAPEVVLAEVEFSDGTALDLIKRIREIQGQTKTIILVHTRVRGSMEVVKKAAIEAGADGVLPKPMNLQNLSHYVALPPIPSRAQEEMVPPVVGTNGEVESLPSRNTGSGPHLAAGDQERSSRKVGFVEAPTKPREPRFFTELMEQAEPEEPSGPTATIRGSLEKVHLIDILALAARDNVSRSIRLETEQNNWCEMVYHNHTVMDVRSWGVGPDVVDVALREGSIEPSIALRLRLDLLEKGERLAQRILGRAGMSNDAISRLLELAARERILAASQLKEGSYVVVKGIRPRFVGLPIAIPLASIVSDIVDRAFSLATIIGYYSNRERDIIRKTPFFRELLFDCFQEPFNHKAIENLPDGEPLQSWIRLNRDDKSRCFLLLFKLEHCGAITVGSGSVVLSELVAAEANAQGMLGITGLPVDHKANGTGVTQEGPDGEVRESPPDIPSAPLRYSLEAGQLLGNETEVDEIADIPLLSMELSAQPPHQPGEMAGQTWPRETSDSRPESQPLTDTSLASLLHSYVQEPTSALPSSTGPDHRSPSPAAVSPRAGIDAASPSASEAKAAGVMRRGKEPTPPRGAPPAGKEGTPLQGIPLVGREPTPPRGAPPAGREPTPVFGSPVAPREVTPWRGSPPVGQEGSGSYSAVYKEAGGTSKPASAQGFPELDELGDKACETWLHAMSPIIKQDRQQQAPEELLKHLSRATLPKVGSPMHLFILGMVAISRGKLDAARSHLKQALAGSPKDKWVNAALALIQAGYYSQPSSDLSLEGVWKTIRNVATQKG